MPGIARLTDIFVGVCACHPPLPPIPMGGTIVTASGNTTANSLGVARITDIVVGYCGHIGLIVSASGDIKVNDLGMARVGDTVVGCLTGIISTGSGDSLGNSWYKGNM